MSRRSFFIGLHGNERVGSTLLLHLCPYFSLAYGVRMDIYFFSLDLLVFVIGISYHIMWYTWRYCLDIREFINVDRCL